MELKNTEKQLVFIMGSVYSLEDRINSVSFLIDDLTKVSIADGYQTPWYVEWQLEGAKNSLHKLEAELKRRNARTS